MTWPIVDAQIAVWAALLVLVGLYLWRADFERYSVFCAGVYKRVDRTPVEGVEFECAEPECENQTELAERRRWYREAVVAGMPVLRYDGGESHYCEEHLSFEFRQSHVLGETSTRTERLAASIANFVAAVAYNVPELEDEDRSQFDDVTAATASAFDLLPVLVLVLFLSAIVGGLRRLAAVPRE